MCGEEGPPHTHLADDPGVVLCDEETPGTRAAHGGWSTQFGQACRPAVTGPASDTGSSDQNNSAVGEHAPDDVVGDLAHVEPPKVVGHEGLPVRHSQRHDRAVAEQHPADDVVSVRDPERCPGRVGQHGLGRVQARSRRRAPFDVDCASGSDDALGMHGVRKYSKD